MRLKRELKVGLIAAAVFVVFIWGFSFIKGSNWFTPNYHYFAVYNNSAGIEAGRAVKINGVPVGKVSNVYFTPEDLSRIVVRFEVDKKYSFTKNTIAQISAGEGLMSDVELNLLVASGELLAQNGDTLRGKISGGMTDAIKNTIEPIKGQLIATLSTMDSVLHSLSTVLNDKNKSNIEATLADLQVTMKHTSSLTASLDAIASSNEKNINSMLEDLSQSSAKINSILDTISVEKVAATFDNLSQSAEQLSSLLQKANSTEGSVGLLLSDPQMYQNLTKASASLNSLLEDLKQNPKRYVNITVFGKKEKTEKAVDKSK